MHEATGKTQTLNDRIDPARAVAMHATLGLDGPPPGTGDPLPPFWHQAYFWTALPPDMLGADGHPKTGTGLIPDLGLAQRMWAGGRLEFTTPLRIGEDAERVTTVESVTEKTGRSGRLGFVTLRHEFRQNGALALTEWQDIVYREPPQDRSAIAPPIARTDETLSETHSFNPTLLFRYSALTFNGHRIHYDQDYARQVEGYTGLVVHGPLLAQMLMHLAERQLGGLNTFSFRATSALMHHETADFCWSKDGAMWVRGPDGRQCMQATAS